MMRRYLSAFSPATLTGPMISSGTVYLLSSAANFDPPAHFMRESSKSDFAHPGGPTNRACSFPTRAHSTRRRSKKGRTHLAAQEGVAELKSEADSLRAEKGEWEQREKERGAVKVETRDEGYERALAMLHTILGVSNGGVA